MPFDRNELQQMQSLYSLISENHTPETSETPGEKSLSELSRSDLYMALDTLRHKVMKDSREFPPAGDAYGNGSEVNEREVDVYLSDLEDPRHPNIKISTTVGELKGLNFDDITDPEEKADFEQLRNDSLMYGEIAAAGYHVERRNSY